MPFSLTCRNSQPCSHIRPQSLKSARGWLFGVGMWWVIVAVPRSQTACHPKHICHGYTGALRSRDPGPTLYYILTWTSSLSLSSLPIWLIVLLLSHPNLHRPGWLGHVTAELWTLDTPTATRDRAEFQLMNRSAAKAWLCWPPTPAPSERLQEGGLCCPDLRGRSERAML